MAAPEIDVFLRAEVGPFLENLGYLKDKRLYRRSGGDGSAAIVAFEKLRIDVADVVAFEPQCGVAAVGVRPWLSGELQAAVAVKPLSIGDAQYVVRLAAPEDFDLQRLSSYPAPGRWGVTQAEAAAAGERLRALLAEHVLPMLDRALAGERDADALAEPDLLPVITAHRPFSRPRVWN